MKATIKINLWLCMSWRRMGRQEVYLHAFCTSALTGKGCFYIIKRDRAECNLSLKKRTETKRKESGLTSERQEEYTVVHWPKTDTPKLLLLLLLITLLQIFHQAVFPEHSKMAVRTFNDRVTSECTSRGSVEVWQVEYTAVSGSVTGGIYSCKWKCDRWNIQL